MKRSGESTRSASDDGDVLRLASLRVQEDEQGDARDAVHERERRHPADRVHDVGPAELPAAPQRRAHAEPLDDRRRHRKPDEPEEREPGSTYSRTQHREREKDDEPARYALTSTLAAAAARRTSACTRTRRRASATVRTPRAERLHATSWPMQPRRRSTASGRPSGITAQKRAPYRRIDSATSWPTVRCPGGSAAGRGSPARG